MALLGRILRKGNKDPNKVYLGAFGKHPAWDDFMAVPRGVDTGLGLETEPLVEIKRFLQNEGVLRFEERVQWSDLDSGAWLEVFRHDFLWRKKDTAVVGRFWSSSDSKGRRLPMFVAIQASGCPLALVLRKFLPRLDDLERQCKSASSAAEIDSVLDAFRAQLRNLAESFAGRRDDPADSFARMAALAGRSEWGPDRVGFYRVLHQIERDTSDYRSPKPGESGILWGPKARHPQHVRVPAPGGSPAEECLVWTELLLETLHASTPVLAVMPRGKPYLDLIIGGPTAEELHCTIDADIQLPSDIPYKLRPDFVENAKNQVKVWEDHAVANDDGESRSGRSPPAPGTAKRRSWRGLGLGLLGLGVLAVLAVFFLLRDDEGRRWREYCEDHSSWLGAFLGDLSDERIQRYRTDSDLDAWITVYEDVKKKHDGIPDPPKVSAEDASLRADLIGLSAAIRKSLTTSGWRKLARVETATQKYRERGWDSPANYLDVSLGAVTPGPEAPVAAAIDHVIAIDRALTKIGVTWKGLQVHQDAIARSENPFLGSFDGHVRTQAAGARDLDALLERLGALEELGGRLARVVGDEWERVATEALPGRLTGKPTGVTREIYESWLQEIPGYYRLTPDPRDDPKIDELLGRVEKKIGELEASSPGPARETRRRYEDLARKLQADRGLPGIALHREQIDKNKRMRLEELDALVADLGGAPIVDADSRRDWLAGVRATSELSSFESINEAYRRWRDRLLEGVTPESIPGLKIADYSEIEARVRRLKESLAGLDRALESGRETDAMTGELQQAYQKRRAAALRSAIEAAEKRAPGGGCPDFGSLVDGPEFKGLLNWVEEAAGLARDFGRTTAWLRSLVLLDDVPPGEDRTLRQLVEAWKAVPAFSDPAVQQALGSELAELKRLERIASLADRSELRSLAGSEDQPSAARLAAWRRLGELEDPPWPDSAGELAQERAIVDGLRALVAQLDPAREKTLTRQLTSETGRRWDVCFGGLVEHDDVGKALGSMADFGVQREQLEPSSRFKILVYELRSAVEGKDETRARARLQRFLAEVQKTLPEYSKRAGIAEFLGPLVQLAAEAPVASDDRGPASSEIADALRWTLRSEEGRRRVYAWTPRYDSAQEYTLEFHRLDPSEPDREPAYLCATEVSIGLFIEVIRAAEGWSELRSMRTNRWIGPRGWTLTGDVMELATGWLDPRFSARRYPPGIDPGRPTSGHPIQRLSPYAAVYFVRLLDCRLPSPSEWKRALAGDRTPRSARNLRDSRCKRYLEYLSEAPASLEAFDPEKTDAGRHHEGDDGFLWFAPVRSPAASPFHHLVGNVAEYTFDSPAALEAVNDLQQESILGFVGKGAGDFGVIGGSALSPLALDVETVHPLPTPIRKTKTGFSDVGLRLAFTAPKASLATSLHQILVGTGYSWK